MSVFTRILDDVISGLGYTKAAELSNPSQTRPIFRGEGGSAATNAMSGGGEGIQGRLEKQAITTSWVYSNINLIANEVGQTTPQVVKRTEGESFEQIISHEFERILERPNPYMGRSFLLRYTVMWLQLRGEAYWLLVRDKAGNLAEVWPLPSDRITPIPDETTYIKGYLYKPKEQGDDEFLEVEEVCYFREPNPYDFHRGFSKISSYRYAMETDRASVKWNLETIEQQATLRTLLSLPSSMSQRNYETIRQEIIRELENKRSRWMIVRGGDLTSESIGMTQQDLEYLDGRAFNREEIDRVFGVPGGLWDKSATEANAKVAYNTLINHTVWPLLKLMSEEISNQIMYVYYDEDIIMQFEDIRPVERQLELDENKLHWEAMNVDEVRSRLGLAPFGDNFGAVPWAIRNNQSIAMWYIESLQPPGGFAPEEAEDEELVEEEPLESLETSEIQAETDEEPQDGSEVAEENKSALSANKARRDDFHRWRSVASRQVKRMGFANYDFKSEFITPHESGLIRHYLLELGEEKEVKALFAHVEDFLSTDFKALFEAHDDLRELADGLIEEGRGLVEQANSGMPRGQFLGNFRSSVIGFNSRAFAAGAGKDLEEFSEDELLDLEEQNDIAAEQSALLADDVYAGVYAATESQSEERAGEKTGNRLALWALTLGGIYALGQMRKSDANLIWVLGNRERHCSTCMSLAGSVASTDDWRESGYYPQAKTGVLECGGWRCDCRFMETDQIASGVNAP